MQTPEQVQAKIDDMYADLRAKIQERIEHILTSGLVDLADYEDNFHLPKLLYVDALRYVADGYAPLPWDHTSKRRLAKLARH